MTSAPACTRSPRAQEERLTLQHLQMPMGYISSRAQGVPEGKSDAAKNNGRQR